MADGLTRLHLTRARVAAEASHAPRQPTATESPTARVGTATESPTVRVDAAHCVTQRGVKAGCQLGRVHVTDNTLYHQSLCTLSREESAATLLTALLPACATQSPLTRAWVHFGDCGTRAQGELAGERACAGRLGGMRLFLQPECPKRN